EPYVRAGGLLLRGHGPRLQVSVGPARRQHGRLEAVDQLVEALELGGLHICLENPNSECVPSKDEPLNGSRSGAGGAVRLRRSIRMAGTVVATPTPRSAKPIRFRGPAGMRLAASRPSPNASAARVPTTNPNERGLRLKLCMGTPSHWSARKECAAA